MQFRPILIAKYLLHQAFPDWTKTQFDPITTQFQPNSATKWLSNMTLCALSWGTEIRGIAP